MSAQQRVFKDLVQPDLLRHMEVQVEEVWEERGLVGQWDRRGGNEIYEE